MREHVLKGCMYILLTWHKIWKCHILAASIQAIFIIFNSSYLPVLVLRCLIVHMIHFSVNTPQRVKVQREGKNVSTMLWNSFKLDSFIDRAKKDSLMGEFELTMDNYRSKNKNQMVICFLMLIAHISPNQLGIHCARVSYYFLRSIFTPLIISIPGSI